MPDYYNLIMGRNDSSFVTTFNKLLKKELESQNLPYTNAIQIENGNRLRPILMAWGYYTNYSNEKNAYIADYAISIELLHKASILLDDLIDEDIARHERKTFHILYSKSEALLYAIYILNRSITLIHEKDINDETLYTSTLLKIVDNMARGGIKEITSTNNAFNLEDAKEIIELETVSLIENSFTLGYKLSNPACLSVPDAIINIGHSCGYCFQVLNDMEPFAAPHINKKYKGNVNYDFEKHRKNIVISYLYGCCTQHERKHLATTSDFEYICKLVKKYDVLAILLNELESEIIELMQQCLYFKNSNLQFYNDFKKFLMVMFNICYKKCDLPLKNELFND